MARLIYICTVFMYVRIFCRKHMRHACMCNILVQKKQVLVTEISFFRLYNFPMGTIGVGVLVILIASLGIIMVLIQSRQVLLKPKSKKRQARIGHGFVTSCRYTPTPTVVCYCTLSKK